MKILDIQIFKTEEGYKIESTGYHPNLTDFRVLPSDRGTHSRLELTIALQHLLEAHLVTQQVLTDKGYEGYREWLKKYNSESK